MRENQYKKLKQLLHGRNNYGEELEIFEYTTSGIASVPTRYPSGNIIGPIRIIKRKLNKFKRFIVPIHIRDNMGSSYNYYWRYEMSIHKRLKKVFRLRISTFPSTSFYKTTVYDFINEDFDSKGKRVYKLRRKGEQ